MKKKLRSIFCIIFSTTLLLCSFSSCINNNGDSSSNDSTGTVADNNSDEIPGISSISSSSSTDLSSNVSGNENSTSTPATSTILTSSSSSLPGKPGVKKNTLYGIGSLLSRKKEVTIAEAATLINYLGAGSIRDVMNCTQVLDDPKTVNKAGAKYFHDLYSALKLYGVQVIALNATWFLPDGKGTHEEVPKRDTKPGSQYMKFLEDFKQTWKTLVKEFPEVTHWEMGNELNHTAPVPMGWTQGGNIPGYTLMEKADITTDMIYYAHKGIKEANPNAVTIFPGMAPVDGIDGPSTTNYLTRVYENIKSGKFGSKKTTDFFDAMAWHPYWPFTCPDEKWVEENHKLYRIMQKYGDGNKKVYLTEAGFRDDRNAAADKKQAPWIPVMYDLTAKKLPYVESLHYYWLFNHGQLDPYGLMNEPSEGYSAKEKGLAYQKMTGGKGDLNRYVIKWDEYKSGDNVARRVPVKASSTYEESGWALWHVVDGNTKTPGWTNWYAPGSHPWVVSPNGNGAPNPDHEEWIELIFPEACEINKVLLYGRDVIDSKHRMIKGLPRKMYVSVSTDGKKWTKVADYEIKDAKVYPAGQEFDANVKPYTISFNPVKAKHVKITFTKLCPFPETTTNPGDNYYVQLHQIEVIKK